jgi:hypothetical protein
MPLFADVLLMRSVKLSGSEPLATARRTVLLPSRSSENISADLAATKPLAFSAQNIRDNEPKA